ncbi:MAG: citrate (Si)-synthase [Candidatus Neomarinimicrobiota bacterium]
MPTFKEKLTRLVDPMKNRINHLVTNYGDVKVSDVSIAQIYSGTRGVKSMICETSMLDPDEGIRYRGYSLPELIELLPSVKGGSQPLPEGLFYLLLTGNLPTEDDVQDIQNEYKKYSEVPEYVFTTLDNLPKELSPMTQLSLALLTLQGTSEFSRQFRKGMVRKDLWEPALEDSLSILAKLPTIAAYIYRRTYKDGIRIDPHPDLDWAANLAYMMGIKDKEVYEIMRLFLFLHADHEGGNVTAHTVQLVGSTLSDPFYAFSAGLNGLAGPLHGMANQQVLHWIEKMRQEIGNHTPTKKEIEKYVWDTLNAGRLIPGFGHAVLRKTDPRYTALREFALQHFPDDELFKIVSNLYEVVPDILRIHGKAKNPWPNVDAHSGSVLYHYGIKEFDFYTVLFGVSRAQGVLAWYIWARLLGASLERPKSVTTEYLEGLALNWDDSLSVGIFEIDNDHRALVEHLKLLIEAYHTGKADHKIHELFSFLEDYVKKHLSLEEHYMEKYNYPEYEEHKRQHEEFKELCCSLRDEFKEKGGTTRLVILVKQMLVDHFTAHVRTVDRKMADFFKNAQHIA